MKKISLFIALTLIGTFAFSQVIFQVQTPSSIAGSYGLTYATAANSWGSPDLTIPANAITDTLMFVDVPGGDTIACAPPLTANLTGKIAVLYRASCQFGSKALAAQNAGAIGCIIINNVGGAPIGMLGGTDGMSVTIPVIMISDVDGALLRDSIIAGNVTAFIGNKLGLFPNDLGAKQADIVKARRFSNIAALSVDSTEFKVQTGLWVRNFGNQTQFTPSVKVDISLAGAPLYTNTATIDSIQPGDSAYVSLGTFAQGSYASGYYDMTYTITPQNTDGDLSDNVLKSGFMIDQNIYAYSRLDTITKLPISSAGFRPGTFTSDYENCLAFDDPNASRVLATGMTFSTVTNAADSLTNQFVEIRAYQWNDVFTDVNDAALAFANLVQLDQAFYVYTTDAQDSNIYVPFNAPIALTNNQRYLFCFNTGSTVLFLGFDNQIDYTTTQATYLQPSFPSTVDAHSSSYLNGFGLNAVPAISVTMQSATGVNNVATNNNITPYPNPAKDLISIPVGKLSGTATLEITDLAGKLVKSQHITFSKNNILKVDVANIANGSYIFNMIFENGTTNTFKVVVSR